MSHRAIRYAKTIDGLHIAYQVVGEGPVDLVYAPGWFSNLEAVWDVPDLADFLGELASAFRLILLDRRGFGLSDWPITSGSLSLELGMDDIRAVMDAAGSERAVLFGFDEGGALCTLFAASYPERVSALVLFAVWAKYYASSDYPWGWTTDEAEEWWQLIDRHWGTERFWEANSTVVEPAIRRDPERIKAWTRYARLSASPGSALAIERKSRETDIRALLKAVSVPTLVMHRTNVRTSELSRPDTSETSCKTHASSSCPAKSMPRSRGIGNACCESFKTSSHRSRQSPSWNEFSQPFSSHGSGWLDRASSRSRRSRMA